LHQRKNWDKILIDKFMHDSVLSYKEFGPFKPWWEIKDKTYVNEFYNRGRERFLKDFCINSGWVLKPEFRPTSLEPTAKYFPYIVAAAYKLGMIIGTPEEVDVIDYISRCK
jgi:hypothetical protein